MKDLNKELEQRKLDSLYRNRRVLSTPQATEAVIDGKKITSFCSNDYLGLANHPEVKKAFIKGVELYGVGSGASHLVSGHSKAHHQLEEELADFTGFPRALLFSTGYMANLAIAQSLLGKGDGVFEDRLNHASLIDSGLLSDARFVRFPHSDIQSLKKKLAGSNCAEKLVMTDGVFSMDGDIAKLDKLSNACNQHGVWLAVDDAHGLGTLGANGKGSLEYFDLTHNNVPILIGTLGKAFGTAGAFVAGSEAIIETLIQKARTYIYTTAMPPAVAEATRCSLQLIKDGSDLRKQLNDNIDYFRDSCRQCAIPLLDSMTAIQPIVVGDSDKAVNVSNELFDKDILVTAIRPPTVPAGTSRLRVTLSAAHKRDQIDRLILLLQGAIK